MQIEKRWEEVAQVQAELQECLAEMQRSNARMKQDQAEIERLRLRTRAMLADLRNEQGLNL